MKWMDILDHYPKKLMDRNEEIRIGKLPKDHQDRWLLVTHNARFIVHMMSRWMERKFTDPVYLFTELQDSMIESSKTYDGSTRFISYAVSLMRWRIMNIRRSCSRTRVRDQQLAFFGRIKLLPTREDVSEEAKLISSSNPETEMEERECREILLKKVSTIERKRDQEIIVKHFGLDGKDPITLRDLAKFYKVSPARIKQIKDRVLNKLKQEVSEL